MSGRWPAWRALAAASAVLVVAHGARVGLRLGELYQYYVGARGGLVADWQPTAILVGAAALAAVALAAFALRVRWAEVAGIFALALYGVTAGASALRNVDGAASPLPFLVDLLVKASIAAGGAWAFWQVRRARMRTDGAEISSAIQRPPEPAMRKTPLPDRGPVTRAMRRTAEANAALGHDAELHVEQEWDDAAAAATEPRPAWRRFLAAAAVSAAVLALDALVVLVNVFPEFPFDRPVDEWPSRERLILSESLVGVWGYAWAALRAAGFAAGTFFLLRGHSWAWPLLFGLGLQRFADTLPGLFSGPFFDGRLPGLLYIVVSMHIGAGAALIYFLSRMRGAPTLLLGNERPAGATEERAASGPDK